MYRVFCNGCYTFFNRERMFSLTSCGHVYCSNCLPHGNRENCKICKRKFSKMLITKQMPETTSMLFKDLKRSILSFQKVVRFQSDQNEFLVQHLSKENERLKRLVSCFKKRIDFLKKNSSNNVTRQMYATIKQEPIDDDYIVNNYSVAEQMDVGLNGLNGSIKNDQFDNVDWNENMDMDDYEKKTRQYVNSKNYVPQMQNFPEPKENGLAADLRKMGINVSRSNLAQMNNQRISIGQDRPIKQEDSKQWNYPQPMYHYNAGLGVEKLSKPQPPRQSTIDQFLLRGNNNFINRVPSNHFPFNPDNQRMGPIGSVSYPQTILATRPIDAETISRQYE